MLPLLWAKYRTQLLQFGAVLLLAVAAYLAWSAHESSVYKSGYDAAVSERKQADDEALAKATARAFKETTALQEAARRKEFQRQQEQIKYETELDTLRAAARAGRSGMRLPAGTCPRIAASENTGTVGGPVDQAGSVDLMSETSVSVLDAAADLRQGVLREIALADAYNVMRAACNAP